MCQRFTAVALILSNYGERSCNGLEQRMHHRDHQDDSQRSNIPSSSVIEICSCSGGCKGEWALEHSVWLYLTWWTVSSLLQHSPNKSQIELKKHTHTHTQMHAHMQARMCAHTNCHLVEVCCQLQNMHDYVSWKSDLMLAYKQVVSEIQTQITTKGQLILETLLHHISADLNSPADRKLKLNELETQKELKAGIVSCPCSQRQRSE